MITGMVVLALAARAQGTEAPRCDLYWERRHGPYAGGRLFTTYCRSPAVEREPFTLTVEARWEGASGEVVRSKLLEASNVTIEDKGLDVQQWSFEAVGLEGSALGPPSWTRYASAFDATSRTFGPAQVVSREGWQERQQRLVDDRVARQDRLVVAGLVGQPSPGDMAWYDGVPSYARAVRDAAWADQQAGRVRDAADRVLALFALWGDDQSRQTAMRRGKEGQKTEVIVPLVGSLWLDLTQPEVLEVVRDLASVLDDAGEYTAAAALYGAVAAAGGGPPPGVPPSAPPGLDGDPSGRFLAALEQGDLERALGAAAAGGFSARARSEWWQAGARELLRRKEQGDLEAIPPLLRYLGRIPDGRLDDDLETALKPSVLALSGVEGATVWTWMGEPDDPEELVARSRMSRNGSEPLLLEKALQMAGAQAVISIGVSQGDLCAVIASGPDSRQVICGRKDTKAKPESLENPDLRLKMRRCTASDWPCFAPTHQASIDGGFLSCGVDALGQAWCKGDGPIPPLEPAQGEGWTMVVAGAAHACALHGDHHVSCWGDSKRGQAPKHVERAVDVAAYGTWTCVLDLDGRVSCRGKRPPRLPQLPSRPDFLTEEDYARLVR